MLREFAKVLPYSVNIIQSGTLWTTLSVTNTSCICQPPINFVSFLCDIASANN